MSEELPGFWRHMSPDEQLAYTTMQHRKQMLADAIVLERASKVVRRVFPRKVLLTDAVLHAVVAWLDQQAAAWRREAEHD